MHEPRRRPADTTIAVNLRASADSAIGLVIKAGAIAYERRRDLPRLIRLAPEDCDAQGMDHTRMIVARLQRALRAERNRARAGHWTYDLNRHIALRQAFRAENERLVALEVGSPPDPVTGSTTALGAETHLPRQR